MLQASNEMGGADKVRIIEKTIVAFLVAPLYN